MRNKLVLVCLALSGTAALTYEVVWTRALGTIVGSTTYALSTVLGAFMTGLALGAFIGGSKAVQQRRPLRTFAFLELGIAVSGFATLLAIGQLPPLYAWIYYGIREWPAVFFAAQFAIVFVLMLVPTTLMGMTFPVAVRAWTRSLESAGHDSGSLYSVNTLGAVVGSMAAGFLLIPLLGMNGANQAAAALNLLSAALLGVLGYRQLGAALILIAGGAAAHQLTAEPVFGFNIYLAGRAASYEDFRRGVDRVEVVWEREDPEGKVQVTKSKTGPMYGITIRGKPEGAKPSGDQPNQLLMAYLGAAYVPDAKTFLKVGLGPGVTLHAASSIDTLELLDVVEINPSVAVAVEKFFYPGLLGDPRVHVIEDDARRYLSLTDARYDIISSQSSDPTDAGSGNLFSREYYEIVKRRLSDDGVFVEHVPTGLLGQEGSEVFIKTLASVFPYVYEWDVTSGSQNVLAVASLRPLTDATTVAGRILERNPHLEGAFKFGAGPERVRKLLGWDHVALNTDDRPRLEFTIAGTLLKP